MRKLQYQLANGNFVDCKDREEEFFNKMIAVTVKRNAPKTKSEIIEMLNAGKQVQNNFGEVRLILICLEM